ncbi:MAG: DMT family transporter [Rhodospirillaceae bacterium]|nr:DMT family transporter [Rhodospirillaceae bacterium]MBT5458412.1 DMT family transporter [Rhodospirillaceae bacterium]
MVCGGACWTAMTVLVRELSADYSAFQLLFARNIVAISILLPPALMGGGAVLRTNRLGLHCLRALFAYLGVLGLFFGVSRLPLPDVTALSFTQPLFVVIMAALVLKEAVGRGRWRAVLFGLVGLLVIVRPGFTEISVATLAVLLSAMTYACANICVKRLMTTDTPTQAVVFFNLLMLPLSLIPALFFWINPDWPDLLRMLAIGLAGTLSVYSFARALSLADASAVLPFDFLRLPMAALAAFLLFAEVGDIWTWIGSLIIFSSSYTLARLQIRPETPSNREKTLPERSR